MDPLSLPSPSGSFLDAARNPNLPEKIAFSMDLGFTPVDSRVRSVISNAVDQLSNAGCNVVEASPDCSGLDEIFYVLRANGYAAGLGELADRHGDQLNPNVLWNIRAGQDLKVTDIHRAEAERVKYVQRMQAFFDEYPVILCPATIVPPYPVDNDHVAECDGHAFENYYQWLGIAYAFTVGVSPALSLPCGFTADGLPVGLQVAAGTYEDARVVAAAARIEEILELDTVAPIDPRTPSKPM